MRSPAPVKMSFGAIAACILAFSTTANARPMPAPGRITHHLDVSNSTSEISTHNITKHPRTGPAGYVFHPANNGWDWPTIEQWRTFDELWDLNKDIILWGCDWQGRISPTVEERDIIYNAINEVAAQSGVDRRWILAIVMQESNGCAGTGWTQNGVHNPGLMQSHNGEGKCFTTDGHQIIPCPADMIYQMINDGARGTAHGNGLAQAINLTSDAGFTQATFTGAQAYYWTSRMYDSGENISPFYNLRDGKGATDCYAMDVANILTGWPKARFPCG